MKPIFFMLFIALITVASALIPIGCAEPGEDGTTGIDCGEFGSEHDGHCHCSDGFGFNGETCVALAQITEVCTAEPHTDADHTEDDEHQHASCVCAGDASDCACEGDLVTYGTATYCLPELHDHDAE